MTRLFFVAGESSGDIHGASAIRALRKLDPAIDCEGIGGSRMAAAGMRLRHDLAAHAIMGFTEVVRSLALIRRLLNETISRLDEWRPDALVLIDYPGFNMRLARAAHARGICVIYYISPQVWAWRRGRVKALAKTVDKMLVILPFEKAIYDQAGLDCVYVGHPLIDHIANSPTSGQYAFELTIGLMPGSRRQEIDRILPIMLNTARSLLAKYPEARFVAPCVDADRKAQIQALAGDFPLETAVGGSYEVLSAARFCLVASGTATVEAMIFLVPMIVLYKTSALTYRIARRLSNVKMIAMVNILAGRRIVPEFIQHEATAKAIVESAIPLIEESPQRAAMIRELEQVRELLGGGGASELVAREILASAGVKHA